MSEKNVDTSTCWYQNYCIEEMNRFHDQYIKGHDLADHFSAFTELLNYTDEKGCELIDLGCGTAMLNAFCREFKYIGADLPHMISGCAMRNYPEYFYRACDLVNDDLSWIKNYKVAIVNGVIDIMQYPSDVLGKVLDHCQKYLIIHRQEITEHGKSHTIVNGSYGGTTYHSIFSREDFLELLDRKNFEIVKEIKLKFGNWENGGSSFLLRRRRSWALFEMDYKLNQYFLGKRNGFFIEAGANDGKTQSNTLYFEFYKNWTGILIEPVTELAHACHINRSIATRIVNCALVSNEYESRTAEIVFTPDCGGLLSVINDDNADKMMQRTKEKGVFQTVSARTLNEILNDVRRPGKIDLLVLDIEGYEIEALKGIDFEKWQIEYLLIEELEENNVISELLSPYYERIDQFSEHDYFYKRKK